MLKTLVIVLSETRASELTFDNFKKNVINELNADLCVCIGVKPDYDYDNPFYKLAKYKFTYDEPDDYGDAFEYAYNTISANRPKYECLKDMTAIHSKITNQKHSNEDYTYYGYKKEITEFDDFLEDENITHHSKDFSNDLWKNVVYGIKKSKSIIVSECHVNTYMKPLYWREFLKIKDQFLGGIKDDDNQHPGSAGILIFFRWFLLKNIIDNDLINKYDRFIITRSDFIYQLPHPKVENMNENFIWIPDCEYYNGYTDRHVILSKKNIICYLNILNNMVLKSNEYFIKMENLNIQNWNLELLIKFHLGQNNVLHTVKEMPYIMYTVRNINGKTRWMSGIYSNEFGYFIKYHTEYNKSSYYKNEFENSGLTIDEFYSNLYENDALPLIGLGVGGYDYITTYNAVLQALKIGYRLIDTAENYHNEDAVGNAIIDSGIDRKKITIISKYFGGINYDKPNDVINSFNNSLQKLKTNYIDIYLIHKPFSCKWTNEWQPIIDNKFVNYKNRLSVWLQFIELKKLNLVKYIGVSNWTLENINEIKLNDLYIPDIIQIEWCPSYYDGKLYDFCMNNSIKIIGYGLFSRNSLDEIQHIELNEKNKHQSEILIKWCMYKKIIVIPRSNDFSKLLKNFNTSKQKWELCDEDIKRIDNTPQKSKGHCLKKVYEQNYSINLWKPLIMQNSNISDDNNIQNLINGNISCIIINNVITKYDCVAILKKMEDSNLLKNQTPYDNFGICFRDNEIGITIDNSLWRENPSAYFNECTKVNKLFETVFHNHINPFEILFDTIKKVAGNKYEINRMKNSSDIESPKGMFRIMNRFDTTSFPYHTDGFNYGKIINESTHINRSNYSVMSKNINTNSVIGVVFIIQEPGSIYEVNLYNCLVDDLELYKNDLGMYSHWMGTKYNNIHLLEKILENKPYYTPLLNTGSIYFFSASRIHKVETLIAEKNRIVLATFMSILNNEITIYQ